MNKKYEKIRNIKGDAFRFIDRNRKEIEKIGDTLFYYAELGMQEFRTSEYSADALKKAGFQVEPGISGIPPAWMATWGHGEPVIGIHCEADALPNCSQVSGITEEKPIIAGGAPGHEEGHNTNMAVMIGAAVAVKEVLERANFKGTIKLYFAPAEEQLISRPYFLRDGYFDDVHALFHPHVAAELHATYGIQQYANVSVEFIFYGKSAHAGTSPWLAKNALDALILMDIGWSKIQQQLSPSQNSQRVILSGGDQPNVIPSYASVWWFFRDRDINLAYANFERAIKVAEAAAIMTGCSFETKIISTCLPTRTNQTMAEVIQKNIEMVGIPKWTQKEEAFAKELQKKIDLRPVGLQKKIKPLTLAKQRASVNDSGSVSWFVPTGKISFPANIPGCSFHTWSAAVSLTTSIAHKAEACGAKVLAASMIDLFWDKSLLGKVKQVFKKETGEIEPQTYLPEDQKPPTDLNKEIMEKWRPLLERFYLKEEVQWEFF